MARIAIAFAALAIGISAAAPVRAGEAAATGEDVETQPAAASEPEYSREDIAKARWLSYGTTGFGLALTLGVGFIGLGTEVFEMFYAGMIAAPIVFCVGPSLGHYSLGHPLHASLTMVGRLLLGGGGTALAFWGALNSMFGGGAEPVFVLGLVCLGATLGLAIFDFADLEESAATTKATPRKALLSRSRRRRGSARTAPGSPRWEGSDRSEPPFFSRALHFFGNLFRKRPIRWCAVGETIAPNTEEEIAMPSRTRKMRARIARLKRERTVMLSYGIPILDETSGRVEWLTGMFAVDAEDAAAHPLYVRAHALMPRPRSSVFDPFEHADLVPAARLLLEKADTECDADDVLCALAILGHTPTNDALDALFAFLARWPEGDLARVARLAAAECTVLGGELGLFTAAS